MDFIEALGQVVAIRTNPTEIEANLSRQVQELWGRKAAKHIVFGQHARPIIAAISFVRQFGNRLSDIHELLGCEQELTIEVGCELLFRAARISCGADDREAVIGLVSEWWFVMREADGMEAAKETLNMFYCISPSFCPSPAEMPAGKALDVYAKIIGFLTSQDYYVDQMLAKVFPIDWEAVPVDSPRWALERSSS